MRNSGKAILITTVMLCVPIWVGAKIVTLSGTIDDKPKVEEQQTQQQYDYDNRAVRTYEGVQTNYSVPRQATSITLNYIPRGERLTTVLNVEWRSQLGAGRYTGDWDKDMQVPHGKGVMMFDDGSVYAGHFVNGKFDGENEHYWLKDGDSFHGVIRENLWSRGVYETPEGDYYEGDFSLQAGDDVASPWNGIWRDRNGNKVGEVVNGQDR